MSVCVGSQDCRRRASSLPESRDDGKTPRGSRQPATVAEQAAENGTPAEVKPAEAPNPRRARGRQRQRHRRQAEQQARRDAVQYVHEAAARRIPRKEAARRLSISPRTLRHWNDEQVRGKRKAEWRGRPVLPCPLETRNEVIRFLAKVSGPSVGLPALRAVFPKVPRAVLRDLLLRFCRVWRKRHLRSGFQLTWHRPGAVWAMDFTQPSQAIDGVFPYLFAVRDLASHRQLAWQPLRGQAAEDVLPVLARLFGEYGAPLVLKNDNGPGFLACVTKEAMRQARVAQLFSPPAHPQYNGQLERSNAVLKTYTELHAAAEGHPFRLTCADVAHGFWLANTLSRPWGHERPSPEEAWQAREKISSEERARFQAAWSAEQSQAAIDLGLDMAAELSHVEQAELDRLAISRTLQSLGYLTKKCVTRPPKKRKRPSRKKLAKHISVQQEQQAVAEPEEAEPTKPQPTPPLRAPARRPPQPTDLEPANSPPATLPAPDREFSCESAAPLLAETKTGDRMEMAEDANAQRPIVPQAVAPAHGEPAITSWFRRPFTLLLSLAKTVIVSG